MTATGRVSGDRRALLLRAYAAYNNQDVETLLALVSDGVDWPDEAGGLQGKEEVRAYWTKQWARTRTHDEPVGFSELDDGRIAVRISQVVRSLDGSVVSKGQFLHVHRIEAGQIARMDIEAISGIAPRTAPLRASCLGGR